MKNEQPRAELGPENEIKKDEEIEKSKKEKILLTIKNGVLITILKLR